MSTDQEAAWVQGRVLSPTIASWLPTLSYWMVVICYLRPTFECVLFHVQTADMATGALPPLNHICGPGCLSTCTKMTSATNSYHENWRHMFLATRSMAHWLFAMQRHRRILSYLLTDQLNQTAKEYVVSSFSRCLRNHVFLFVIIFSWSVNTCSQSRQNTECKTTLTEFDMFISHLKIMQLQVRSANQMLLTWEVVFQLWRTWPEHCHWQVKLAVISHL